jgi:hypothetical protein
LWKLLTLACHPAHYNTKLSFSASTIIQLSLAFGVAVDLRIWNLCMIASAN